MDDNDNKRKAVIIANGPIEDHGRIRTMILSGLGDGPALVISADGGVFNTLKLGFRPDIIIGDMDSIGKRYDFPGTKFITAYHEKDESDTQLAVEQAVETGIRNIIIAGALGGRIDHTLANIMLLAHPALKDADARIISEKREIFSMDKQGTIKGTPGKLVSIFSLTPYTYFVNTRGLKYALKDEELTFSPVRGLSNVFTATEAELDFKNGRLLIIKEL